MPTEVFRSNAQTTLASSISAGGNPVTFSVASGATFPTGPQFHIRVDSEVMLVTAVSGTNWTATRAADGTLQAAHAIGATVTLVLTSDFMNSLAPLAAPQSANQVFAGPASGPAAAPTFRNLTASDITGTIGIANGGTGQNTASAAINALVPAQSGHSGQYLTTNGTSVSWGTPPAGTVTSVNVSGGTTGLSFSGGPVTSSGTITAGGTLAAANGGTGTSGTNLPHAWVYFTVSGGVVTIQQSYGVASVARAGTGIFNVNYSSTVASANACVVAMPDNLGGIGNLTASLSARSTTTAQIFVTLGSGTATDPSGMSVIIFGV